MKLFPYLIYDDNDSMLAPFLHNCCLAIGDSKLMPILSSLKVLEAFLAPGSQLWMFSEVPEKDREKKLIDGGLDLVGLSNITLVHREGNAVIRRHLENLPLETFDSVSMQTACEMSNCLILSSLNICLYSYTYMCT